MEYFKDILSNLEKLAADPENAEDRIGEYLKNQYSSMEEQRHKGYLPNAKRNESLNKRREMLLIMGVSFDSFSRFVNVAKEPPVSMIMEEFLDVSNDETKFFVESFAVLALRSDLDAITSHTNYALSEDEKNSLRAFLKDESQFEAVREMVWNFDKRAAIIDFFQTPDAVQPDDRYEVPDNLNLIQDYLSMKPLTPLQMDRSFFKNNFGIVSVVSPYKIEGELSEQNCRLSDAFVRVMNGIQCKYKSDTPLYDVCNDLNVYFRANMQQLVVHRSSSYQNLPFAKNALAILGVLTDVITYLLSISEVHSVPDGTSNLDWTKETETELQNESNWNDILRKLDELFLQLKKEGVKPDYFEPQLKFIKNFKQSANLTSIKQTNRGISYQDFTAKRDAFQKYLKEQFKSFEKVVANPFARFSFTRSTLETKGAIQARVSKKRTLTERAVDFMNYGKKITQKIGRRLLGRGGLAKNRTRKIK